MKRLGCGVLRAGVAALLLLGSLPLAAQAQGMALRQGMNYTIGFPDSVALGNGLAKGVATYRVVASAGDQQWYRVRMIARNPQGGWYTPQGTPEVWINLTYAMWVQEVVR